MKASPNQRKNGKSSSPSATTSSPPKHFCGCAPTKTTLNNESEHLVQGNQDARQFAGSTLRYWQINSTGLKRPAIKSTYDVHDKAMAGINPPLHCFLEIAHASEEVLEKKTDIEATDDFALQSLSEQLLIRAIVLLLQYISC